MQVACSNCKSEYNITRNQIDNLDYSIFTCNNCRKYIKITFCPECGSFYSITFSATRSERYRLKCDRCSNSFIVEFPIINDPVENHGSSSSPLTSNENPVRGSEKITETTGLKKKSGDAGPKRQDPSVVFKGIVLKEFSLSEFFAICLSSFTRLKLIVASSGIAVTMLMLMLYARLENLFVDSIGDSLLLKTITNIVPVVSAFFMYIITASVISRITMENVFFKTRWSLSKVLKFVSKISVPVLLGNVIVLLTGNLLLILFGKIPLVGPLFYAVLFLPIYVISFILLVFIIVGFWFYPPIAAYREVGIIQNIKHVFHFIKRHNLNLLYIIPVMTFISAIILSAIYLVHVGAMGIAISISKSVMQDELVRLFSAVPAMLMKITDLSIVGSDFGIFRSMMGEYLISHHIGGLIMGIVLASLSVLLFAVFVSVTATLSSHIYLMMERNLEIEDNRKIRLLGVLVLFLAGIYILKKLFF